MAFAFFRRRRKLVIFVMVFLMMTFLLTLGGGGEEIKQIFDSVTRLFGGRDPNLMATSSVGSLYRKDRELAQQDVEILNTQAFQMRISTPADLVSALSQSGPDRTDAAATGWMLLLREAQKAGMILGPEETRTQIKAMLKDSGGGEDSYEKFLADLRSGSSPVGEKALLQAVGDWLGIERYFQAQLPLPTSSGLEAQQRALFRDLTEQVNLRVVVLQPEAFLAQAGKPTPADINRMFAQYKDKAPGSDPKNEGFDFGYLLGERVNVRYLTVNAEAIRRVSMPEKTEIADYFLKHREEFLLPTATAPGAPASRPANAATMDFYDARPRIIETLRPRVARVRMEELINRLNRDARARAGKVADPLQEVLNAQFVDAKANQALLNKPLPADAVNAVRGMPIDAAMDALAEAAGLAGICFPWGTYREFAIAPNVQVTLSCPAGQTMTLAAALNEIAQQVLPKQALPTGGQPAAPQLTWAAVKGVGDPRVADGRVLYCTASNVGVALSPFHLESTGLVERQEFLENPVLADCRSGRDEGESLADLAYPLAKRSTEGLAASELKPIGKEMFVVHQTTADADLADRVIWQVTETARSQAPTAVTPRIEKQIITDWQTQAVFENQMKAMAASLVEEAKTAGLTEAAKKLNAPATWDTGLFSRMSYMPPPPDRPGSMTVIPLANRVQQMTPSYLDMACKLAGEGDIRAIAPVLSPLQQRALGERLQAVFTGLLQQIESAGLGDEGKAQMRDELTKAARYYYQYGDSRLLLRLANQPLPNGKRLGGEQLMGLRESMLPIQAAIAGAKKWNLALLSVALGDEAKPMYLLGRIGRLDVVKKFLEKAFQPPANIEAPLAELDKPGPAMSFPVPGSGMIVVFQRIGYRPPVAAEFASSGQGPAPDRAKIASYLANQRHRTARAWWFNYHNATARLDYKPER